MGDTYEDRKQVPPAGDSGTWETGAAPNSAFSAAMAADTGAIPNSVRLAALSSGKASPTAADRGRSIGLDDAVREKMEQSFGADLSGVRLYESPTVADAGAEAVARGNEIAFAPGKTDFSTHAGQALLGHELSHVMSQRRGEATGGGFLESHALEARADMEGARAAAGEPVYGGAAAPLSAASAAPAAGPMQASKKNGDAQIREPERDYSRIGNIQLLQNQDGKNYDDERRDYLVNKVKYGKGFLRFMYNLGRPFMKAQRAIPQYTGMERLETKISKKGLNRKVADRAKAEYEAINSLNTPEGSSEKYNQMFPVDEFTEDERIGKNVSKKKSKNLIEEEPDDLEDDEVYD